MGEIRRSTGAMITGRATVSDEGLERRCNQHQDRQDDLGSQKQKQVSQPVFKRLLQDEETPLLIPAQLLRE